MTMMRRCLRYLKKQISASPRCITFFIFGNMSHDIAVHHRPRVFCFPCFLHLFSQTWRTDSGACSTVAKAVISLAFSWCRVYANSQFWLEQQTFMTAVFAFCKWLERMGALFCNDENHEMCSCSHIFKHYVSYRQAERLNTRAICTQQVIYLLLLCPPHVLWQS